MAANARSGVPLELLVDSLAVARLTRLVTTDRIGKAPRDHVIRAAYVAAGRAEEMRPFVDPGEGWAPVVADDPDAPALAYLATCRWCVGLWLAVAVSVARHVAPRWWRPVAAMLVMAEAAGLAARFEGVKVR